MGPFGGGARLVNACAFTLNQRPGSQEPSGTVIEKKGEKWIAKAIKKPGALRKQLGVKKGKKIPGKKLAAAAKKGGKLGKRAKLAKTLKKIGKESIYRSGAVISFQATPAVTVPKHRF